MAPPTLDAVTEAMYAFVKACHGKRQVSPFDLTRVMIERFGGACDKALCKEAIRALIESERCTYSYLGGSYIVLAPET